MIDTSLFPNPSFVLEQELLEQNLLKLQKVKEEASVEIILAFKAFAQWSAFPILHQFGFSKATASSLFEAKLACEEMGSPAHTFAVIYTKQEFDEIAQKSSHLTFNSLSQFSQFEKRAFEVNPEISLGIRINPQFSAVSTDLYNPCVEGSRLGILKEDLPAVLSPSIKGFHFHVLCESNSYDLEGFLNHIDLHFSAYLSTLEWVNLGGGHLITHKDYNDDHAIMVLKKFKAKYPNLHLILEPGSAFGWEVGYLTARVEDIVSNHGIKTAIVNVSFTAHMPDCLEMPYKPFIYGAIDPDKQENKALLPFYPYSYRIGGNSCLAGDYMGDWLFEKPLQVGEELVFRDMIHYTIVKTNMFNGLHHPAICISHKNKCVFKKEFTYENYKSRLS